MTTLEMTKAKLAELELAIEQDTEWYYDIRAEAAGEAAAFGDSWAGSAIQLQKMYSSIRRMERRADGMRRAIERMERKNKKELAF